MKKIVTLLGSRMYCTKVSVVSQAMRQSRTWHEMLAHNDQHSHAKLADVFFDESGIGHTDDFLDITSGVHCSVVQRGAEVQPYGRSYSAARIVDTLAEALAS